MIHYSINNLISDLRDIETIKPVSKALTAVRELDKRIAASYPKKQFFSDLCYLLNSDLDKKIKILSRISKKLTVIDTQKSILFLAEKYYLGQFEKLPQNLIDWDLLNDSKNSVLSSRIEQEVQKKVLNVASALKGYPALPSFVTGTILGVATFSSLVPALLTGAATGMLYKFYKTYQGLGNSPEIKKAISSRPIPGLRHRISRI